jgi:hypothetical protein
MPDHRVLESLVRLTIGRESVRRMRIDRPDHYYLAALERLSQARTLYNQGSSYALAMYISGVAVECMLRAFKLMRDPNFDEKHDLTRLFKASGMLDVRPEVLQAKGFSEEEVEAYLRDLLAAITDISDLWANDYRFASEERLRAHLKFRKLYRGMKGDILKVNAQSLLNSAEDFVTKGVFQWRSSRRSRPS